MPSSFTIGSLDPEIVALLVLCPVSPTEAAEPPERAHVG
jgi:hypothetical protein